MARISSPTWTTAGTALTLVATLISTVVAVLTYLDQSGRLHNPVGQTVHDVIVVEGDEDADAGTPSPDPEVGVEAWADPLSATVPCGRDVTVTYRGRITADRPTTVRYRWVPADGSSSAASGWTRLRFPDAGSRPVEPLTESYPLGAAAGSDPPSTPGSSPTAEGAAGTGNQPPEDAGEGVPVTRVRVSYRLEVDDGASTPATARLACR